MRELDNMMQRAQILANDELIDLDALHFEQVTARKGTPDIPAQADNHADSERLNDDLKQREYELIMEALQSGSRKAAAERLGISQRTLRYKMAKLREEGYELAV